MFGLEAAADAMGTLIEISSGEKSRLNEVLRPTTLRCQPRSAPGILNLTRTTTETSFHTIILVYGRKVSLEKHSLKSIAARNGSSQLQST